MAENASRKERGTTGKNDKAAGGARPL